MSQGDKVQDIKSAVKEYIGVSDDTLAEYIFSIGKQGKDKLKKELSGFPTPFVTKILSILGLKQNESSSVTVGSIVSGMIISINSQSLSVQIEGGKSDVPVTGLISRSALNGIDSIMKGTKIKAQVEGIGNAGQIELRYISDDRQTTLKPAKQDLTTQAPLTVVPSTSLKRAQPELIINRTVPEFAKVITQQVATETNLTPGDARRHWLYKAAAHTSSEVSKFLESNAWREHSSYLDSMGKGKMINRDVERPNNVKTELPVHKFRHEIIQALAENPIIIVVGDTGSGKTTQITQFLYDAGYSDLGKAIVCTQPRRLAAISIAERVAFELEGGKVGGKVGYAVRFDDCTSNSTRVKYMTDGLLQREIISDPDLSKYSAIMLDEAHERTVATDVLFALLKSAVARRPDLRVIVTSATLDAAKFGTYFGSAPILKIPGRMFPVEIKWAQEPVLDYMEATLSTVKFIHTSNANEPGDILVFLTGQAEIDLAALAISKAFPKNDLIPVPIYASIPSEMQSLIFNPAPHGKRKVVFATNIAETSLTIDGIKFVVDAGFCKVQVWDSKKGMGILRVQPISQAQANQRSGRAGRTAPGLCYRLYTKQSFDCEMVPSTAPEIQRENLGHTVLMLKAMGISDLINFDYMDPPPKESIVSSMHELYKLGALDEMANITPLGHTMAAFPLDPSLAKVLITAKQTGNWCVQDILTIIAMVSTPSIFYRPAQPAAKKIDADRAHRRLQDPSSDHLTLLKIFNKWKESGSNKKWCDSNFLQHKNLLKVNETRRQLSDLIFKNDQRASDSTESIPLSSNQRREQVLKALCSGYFQNVAKLQGGGGCLDYTTLASEITVSIHPSSALYKQNAKYVFYSSLLMTSKEYMHNVSQIQPEWLVEAAPEYYQEAGAEDLRKQQKKESIKPLFKKRTLHENEWRVSEHTKTVMSRNRR